MIIKAYARSVIGSREKNQDSYLIEDDRQLYAIADGVGGGVGGEVASSMAVEGIKELALDHTKLKEALETCQERILRKALKEHGAPVMGTTLTVVCVEGNRLHLVHAGDSRCYLFRGTHLELKTEDHEFFDDSLGATVLGSYLGIPTDEHTLQILQDTFEILPGDRVLLCTDGLYRQIEEPRLVELIKTYEHNPEELLEKMTQEAAEHPHSDNISIVYIEAKAKDAGTKTPTQE